MVAMAIILKNCYGANRDALINETARVYGFTRSGQNIYSAMNDALNQLIYDKEVDEEGGKLKLL